MPEFPIIDTHVHFWDRSEARIEWPDPDGPIGGPYHPETLSEHAGPVGIEGLIFVEAAVAEGEAQREAEWVSRLAEQDGRIKGIVAHAPLHLGSASEADLEALSRLPLVKGIRRLIQEEPDPEFCLQPAFVDAVRLLPKFGFHFEICVYHTQLVSAIKLVRQCPDVTFNLNHIAKPGIVAGIRDPWWEEVAEMAALPNVNCKLSGVATEADHNTWKPEDLYPYMERALEVFGPSRIMFGGDWPVATLALAYPRWVELVDTLLAGETEANRRAIFAENARTFYRL